MNPKIDKTNLHTTSGHCRKAGNTGKRGAEKISESKRK